MHAECYLNRHKNQHQMFARVHQQLCETRSVTSYGRGSNRWTLIIPVEEAILQPVEKQPSSSTRGIADRRRVLHSTVWRILNEERMHNFLFICKECNYSTHISLAMH